MFTIIHPMVHSVSFSERVLSSKVNGEPSLLRKLLVSISQPVLVYYLQQLDAVLLYYFLSYAGDS